MSVVTLLEAKAHLRVLESDDDSYIQNLIDVAQAQAEEITSRYLEETDTVFYLTETKEIFELPKSPLIAVDSIEYYSESSGQYETLNAAYFLVNDKREPAQIKLNAGFNLNIDAFHPLKVSYRAGYATLPAPLKQWMLMRIATMYENHEEVVIGATVSELNSDYNDFLISKYRVGRL